MIPWFDLPKLSLGWVAVDVPDGLAVVGAVAGLALVYRRARRAGLSGRRMVDGFAAVLLFALVLGHWLDVLLYRWGEWRADPWLILPWTGGYCSLGALAGVLLATWLFFRSQSGGLRWDYLDHSAVGLLLGLGILRIGCFVGHHHAGRLSTSWLAVQYPGGARLDLALFEVLLIVAILSGGYLTRRRWSRARPGMLCSTIGLAYAAGRFVLELVRGADLESIGRHSDPRYGGLTVVQYAAIILGLAACFVLRARLRARWPRSEGTSSVTLATAGGRPVERPEADF